MFKHVILLLPEIASTSLTLLSLLFISILSTKNILIDKDTGKIYLPHYKQAAWAISFLISSLYLLLVYNQDISFKTLYGIYSTSFTHLLRIILGILFLIYFLYLYTVIEQIKKFEFFIIIVFSFICLNLMLMSCTLLNLFIFLEFFSLCTYYLIASNDESVRGAESAVKYFLFGTLASSFFLLGCFLTYYSTGQVDFYDFSMLLTNNNRVYNDILLISSFTILFLSILLKLGSSLFFFWMSDTYEGVNYPIFLYLNIFPKIVYLTILLSLVHFSNIPYVSLCIKYLLVASLIFGFLGALLQTKIRRLLVFLSIYNTSFFALILWNNFFESQTYFILFSVTYLLNSLILLILFFSILDWKTNKPITSIHQLPCIYKQNRAFALLLVCNLFISSGLPPSILFVAKFLIFFTSSQTVGFLLTSFFLIFSSLNFFLYLRLIRLILLANNSPSFFMKPVPFLISLISIISVFLNLFLIFFLDKVIAIIQAFLA